MEKISRKPNRLKNYDYSQNGYYFITICTKRKEKILCDFVGDDAHIVPNKYGIVCKEYLSSAKEIENFIVMPNHIHFIIHLDNGTMWASSPTKSVPTIVRSFKTMVTKRLGVSLFQRSYYDHIIRNEKDYLRICQYIQNNPLTWLQDRFYK